MDIPSDAQAITVDWLTQALRNASAVSQARVTSFTAEPLKNEQGLSGPLQRLTLAYDRVEETAPTTLIAKFPSTVPFELEIMFTKTFHYEHEVRFYERIGGGSVLRTPRCYHSAIDVTARRYVLLLEDLAPFQSGQWVAGCTLPQAKLALRQIAAFHAAWWEKPGLAQMTWIPQPDSEVLAWMAEMYQMAWDPFCEKMGSRLSDAAAEIAERVGRDLVPIMTYVRGSPQTLVHGDYHLDNLFFPSVDSETEMVVADWQMLMVGRGLVDVAYFLGGNLASGERAKHEMALLNLYHSVLVENGVTGYSFDQCLYDYRYSLLFLLTHFVPVVGLIVSGEQQRKLCDTIVPRYLRAMLELNAGELLAT